MSGKIRRAAENAVVAYRWRRRYGIRWRYAVVAAFCAAVWELKH